MELNTNTPITLKDAWIDLIYATAFAPTSSIQFAGVKYLRDFNFTMPGYVFHHNSENIDLQKDIFYTGPDHKVQALKRIYYDQTSIDKANELLNSRTSKEFTSVTVATTTGKKNTKGTQGHCIIGIVVSQNNTTTFKRNSPLSVPPLRVSIFYRSTEVIKKFAADLHFLHSTLLPDILGPLLPSLTEVTFHFANLAFSPVFFTIMLDKFHNHTLTKQNVYSHSLTSFLNILKITSRVTYEECIDDLRRMIVRPLGAYGYKTRNLMHHKSWEIYNKYPFLLVEVKELISTLEQEFIEQGRTRKLSMKHKNKVYINFKGVK